MVGTREYCQPFLLACGCNTLGTVNNTIQCDQYTGDCPCKASVQGKYCVECRDGFYFFPITENADCLRCPCDLGGAFPQCDKVSGEHINCNSIILVVVYNVIAWEG